MENEPSSLTPADVAAARNAAEQFLRAVERGQEAAAKAMLIIAEGEKLDFKEMHESTASFELGQAKAEGEQVIVEAKFIGPPPSEGTPTQGEGGAATKELPLVLRRVDGAWKVDMGASITRMLGGLDLGAMMEQMAKGLGDAMAKGMEAVGEAFSALSAPEGQAKPADTERPEEKKKAKCKMKKAK